MKRNAFLKRVLIGFIIVMMVPFGALSQQMDSGKTYSEAELDQMLAPIALYPDSLLAQILIAATYPDQVMEADRWLKANPDLKGDALNNALDKMNWDLSVKALAPFPQVLDMMAKETAWTQRLGEAFLAQQANVMDSIQRLRQKAQATGNLQTTEQQKAVVKGQVIEIVPVNPQVVYVPRYDPVVVYGPWWYPAYPPLVYSPCCWPEVAVGIGVFGFWGAVEVGPVWGWGWGSWNWAGGSVNVNVNRNVNINRSSIGAVNTSSRGGAGAGRAGAGAGRAGAGAGRAGAGAGRAGAGRAGTGGRPSAASVQRGLSGGSRAGSSARSGGSRSGSSARSGGSRAGSSARSGGSRSGSRSGSSARSGGSRGGSRSSARSGGSRGGSRSSARSGSSRGGSRSSARSGGSRGGSRGGARGGGSRGGGGRRGGGGGGGRRGGGGGGRRR